MFKTRVISGIILTIITVVLFIFGGPPFVYGKYAFAAVLFLVSAKGYLELTSALATKPVGEEKLPLPQKKEIDILDGIGLLGIATYYLVLAFYGMGTYLFAPLVVGILLMMMVYVMKFPGLETEQILASVFAFLYCPVMLSFILITRMEEYGSYLVWMILIGSWGCDTFAYLTGKAFGKRKVFPVLSPNKSLAGVVGGLSACGILGGLYGHLYIERMTGINHLCPAIAFICLVGGVMSIFGDLAASAIKRKHGFKDYAKLIPGHGGIMDRFDSTIMVAPAVSMLGTLLFTLLK